MDLEKLVWKKPIREIITESLDLLCMSQAVQNLFREGVNGFHFPQKYPKLAMRSPNSEPFFGGGKTKEGPTTRQLQGFLHVGR